MARIGIHTIITLCYIHHLTMAQSLFLKGGNNDTHWFSQLSREGASAL